MEKPSVYVWMLPDLIWLKNTCSCCEANSSSAVCLLTCSSLRGIISCACVFVSWISFCFFPCLFFFCWTFIFCLGFCRITWNILQWLWFHRMSRSKLLSVVSPVCLRLITRITFVSASTFTFNGKLVLHDWQACFNFRQVFCSPVLVLLTF